MYRNILTIAIVLSLSVSSGLMAAGGGSHFWLTGGSIAGSSELETGESDKEASTSTTIGLHYILPMGLGFGASQRTLTKATAVSSSGTELLVKTTEGSISYLDFSYTLKAGSLLFNFGAGAPVSSTLVYKSTYSATSRAVIGTLITQAVNAGQWPTSFTPPTEDVLDVTTKSAHSMSFQVGMALGALDAVIGYRRDVAQLEVGYSTTLQFLNAGKTSSTVDTYTDSALCSLGTSF